MTKDLDAYRAKRDFTKTPEPGPETGTSAGNSFVIQKHDASRLHYDFRIELDGVMKSWAVAKGPSLVPGEKRLAVQTEDHPIAYNAFEGIIPKGQYGGGTVMIWDRGTWEPVHDPHKGFEKGHVDVILHGEKLNGLWHLVRLKRRPREKTDSWLLIKSDDEFARTAEEPDVLVEADRSVVSGRTIPEIAEAGDRVWNSNRGDSVNSAEQAAPAAAKKAAKSTAVKAPAKAKKAAPKAAAAARAALPDFVQPALATLVAHARNGADWVHEIKFDGYRLQARLDHGEVKLLTRSGLDWTHRFPGIREAIAALPAETALLDGEAVVENAAGVSSFSALQQDLGGRGGKLVSGNALYYAFDLLHLDGRDLTPLPLTERKEALATLVSSKPQNRLKLSEHIASDGDSMARHACRLGLEGIICKRADAPYRPGRSDVWLKVKCTERAEFVVAGYLPSTVSSKGVGSLVLGYYDGENLIHAGRVGTGFTETVSRDLAKALEAIKATASPFAAKLSADERHGVKWARPELVAEIEYRGWTHDGSLRHASFKGLREDKAAKDVVREVPKDAPEPPKPSGRPASIISTGATVAGVHLSHPERVLWPEQGITKQGLAEFYAEIADWVLPHVVHRPLSLVRCPSGSEKTCFFQKHAWAGLSDTIRQIPVPGDDQPMLAIDDLAGLIALVQAGVLEIHPWGATESVPDKADRLIFDLDPGDEVEWSAVIHGALEVRERLTAMKLESFVKTTGGKGLHVVVPLVADTGWDDVKAFTKTIAESMAADSPDRYVSTMAKKIRTGRVFVDYLRNGQGATAVAAYSTRSRPGAPVATPLSWDELGPEVRGNHFNVENLDRRLQNLSGDPWAGFFEVRQSLRSEKPEKTRKRR
ncbi:DNA ligase D [Terrihabitans rhizophilus]|uniref:DNA ligase (ATP) n=1 Tax=Terrihabitans rhizophilus TaxID=3092662 RepID=A0ABU4RJ07_9HYPH|nr:DNA ligase D [Terrihabitans sp. PJ23]MDX6804536.1 DNA ligase D [Terrihabitans sp. PJ23]